MPQQERPVHTASDPDYLPSITSLQTISKALLLLAVILQLGSFSEPFVYLFSSETCWYIWISLTFVTVVLCVGGLITQSCDRQADPSTSLWPPALVTVMFWLTTALVAFGMIQFIAFFFYFSMAPHPVAGYNTSLWNRFSHIFLLCWMLAPPLIVHGIGAGFFYRRAQDLRASALAQSGYSGVMSVEMQSM